MGFFDEIFSEAKNNIDKSRQAREFVQQAKAYVNDGNEIYKKAYGKVASYASETEYRLRKHSDYKKKIAEELSGNIGNVLKDFREFNIDSKIMKAPIINASNSMMFSNNTGVGSFASAVSTCMPHVEIPSILNMFISDIDYYEARRQRDEAKYFKERMKMERDKLNNYKEKMSEIRSFIDKEQSELDSLMEKVRKMVNELQSGMTKNSFDIDEADYLKGIHKIAEYILTLLSTEFLGDSFSISQKYQNIFDGIRKINDQLPYSPSISNIGTANAMKFILGNPVVY